MKKKCVKEKTKRPSFPKSRTSLHSFKAFTWPEVNLKPLPVVDFTRFSVLTSQMPLIYLYFISLTNVGQLQLRKIEIKIRIYDV